MIKVKLGAIIKEVPKGSLIWYKKAGWTVLETVTKQEKVKDETDTKKNATK